MLSDGLFGVNFCGSGVFLCSLALGMRTRAWLVKLNHLQYNDLHLQSSLRKMILPSTSCCFSWWWLSLFHTIVQRAVIPEDPSASALPQPGPPTAEAYILHLARGIHPRVYHHDNDREDEMIEKKKRMGRQRGCQLQTVRNDWLYSWPSKYHI